MTDAKKKLPVNPEEYNLRRIEAAEHWVHCVKTKTFTLHEWKTMTDLAVLHIEALAEIARGADTQDLAIQAQE